MARVDRILIGADRDAAESVWANASAALVTNMLMLDLIERHQRIHEATLAEFEQRRLSPERRAELWEKD